MPIAQTTQTTINIADFLLPLIPWVVIFIFVYYILARVLRRQNAHMRRAQEHWDVVEKKLDQLIEVAQRRDK